MTLLKPIEWLTEGKVRFLDQTLLPQQETWTETADYHAVAEAVRSLRVRGAPLIGVSAAYGLALAALAADPSRVRESVREAADVLAATRPTAVNLRWAIDRMLRRIEGVAGADAVREALVEEAQRIHDEDVQANIEMGRHGASLIPDGAAVLTHCNAGLLATGGYGTALGVIQSAHEAGKLSHVFATETRPLLQGARLTVWELAKAGVPHTLIVDGAAGHFLRSGRIQAVVTGADRIAANGDVANKIGTYQHAVLAHENGVPFYVAAPCSTIDLSLPSGDDIPIEERSPDEVTSFREARTAPDGTAAANPAFDVTPNRYVKAIITEAGVAKPPYERTLAALFPEEVPARG